jgi:peroxiredoxin
MSQKIKEIPSYQQQKDKMNKQFELKLPPAIKVLLDNDADQLALNFKKPLKLEKGNKAPLFELPNAAGRLIRLAELLKQGSVVLVFYRGNWCPYCNLELRSYQMILNQIKEKGATLVAISAQTADQSMTMKEKNELQFEVLSDAHNEVSRKYTTIFKIGEVPIDMMKKMGVDFHSFYSDYSGNLPVPAVYVIDQAGFVVFAGSKGGDYRERVEPSEILNALDQL